MGRGQKVTRADLHPLDRSWLKWAKCKMCGRKIAVNNNDRREIDPPRVLGVVCCPWCSEESVKLYKIVKGLAKLAEAGDDRPSKLRKLVAAAKERVGA